MSDNGLAVLALVVIFVVLALIDMSGVMTCG
jgi:hypothetical protein